MRAIVQVELGTVGLIGVRSEFLGILFGIRHDPRNTLEAA
jgi:hypothetical protein